MTEPRGSELINELAAALSKAQGEFRAAKMDAINPFLKNHYADLGSIIKAAKPALAKYGLAVTQPASTDGMSVTVTTMLMHESGQWMASDMTLPLGEEKGRNMAQAAGTIITYLRRYSLSAMVGIYADEDTDGEKPKAATPQAPPKEKLRDKVYVEDAPRYEDAGGPAFTVPANLLTTDDIDTATNSKGELLIDLQTDKLSYMANELLKKPKPGQFTPLKLEARQAELKAITTIIADRNKTGKEE